MRSGRKKTTIKDAIRLVALPGISANEILAMLDEFGDDDRIIDVIKLVHSSRFNDAEMARVVDIIESVDLTKTDEQWTLDNMKCETSSDFFMLATSLRLSRAEIIILVKNGIATNDDITRVMKNVESIDLIDAVIRWRPEMFKNELSSYVGRHGIQAKLDKAIERSGANLKFKFLT